MTPTPTGRGQKSDGLLQPALLDLPTTRLACGTTVLTMDGDMPVEFLSPGDRIITRDSGMARLSHISFSRRPVNAIAIQAGSLGDTRPETDMILPIDQLVLIRDWRAQALFGTPQATVQAGDLTDGEFIRDLGVLNMRLTHLHFNRPHVIYAGGLELVAALPHTERAQAA